MLKVELVRLNPQALVSGNPELMASPLLKVLGVGPWLEEGVMRRFFDGAVVMQQGEEGQTFFVVLAGEVRLFGRKDAESAEMGIARVGDFFGESALLSPGEPRTHSAVTLGQVDVLELPPTVLWQQKQAAAPLRGLLAEVLQSRTKRLDEMSDFLNRW